MKQEYLKIPAIEKLVPFPNFGTVLLQHAREFPQKLAISFSKRKYTYDEVTKICARLDIPKQKIKLSFHDIENDTLLLLACLYQGRELDIDFSSRSSINYLQPENQGEELPFFDPPYVKLDDHACSLNNEYHFSQYQVLLAAQAIGKAFKLFREGASYCPENINSIADLIFGVLAPLYYCKTVEMVFTSQKDYYQYAWKKEISSSLRDAAYLFPKNAKAQGFLLLESFDNALGMGPIVSPEGKMLELLGYEFEKFEDKWSVKGHGVADQ